MFGLEMDNVQYYDAGTVQMSRPQLQQLAEGAHRVFLAGQTAWMTLETDKAAQKIINNERSRLSKAFALLTGGPLVRKNESIEQAAKRHVEENHYWQLSLDRFYLQIPQQTLALLDCMTTADAFTVRQESYDDMAKMASGVFSNRG